MPKEIDLKVKEIIQRTYNVISVRLKSGCDLDYQAGQFLQVTLSGDPSLKRYLSISSSPTEKGYIEFTKKITQSSFSRALQNLKSGDSVRVQYPMGKFILDDPAAKIAFLSGGIGITPIRSIAKFVIDRELGTDMVLLYANRSIKDIVFREDFEAMQRRSKSFKVMHVLCESAPGFKCTVGLINGAVIKNEIPDFLQRKFFLCGPPQMVEAMKNILSGELGLAGENIVTENFSGY